MSEKERRRAVALRYEPTEERAPVVVAKGERLLAERIVAEAQKLGISIVENKKLSENLMSIELNQEIPPEVYQAVAEVIAFVYRMDRRYR